MIGNDGSIGKMKGFRFVMIFVFRLVSNYQTYSDLFQPVPKFSVHPSSSPQPNYPREALT